MTPSDISSHCHSANMEALVLRSFSMRRILSLCKFGKMWMDWRAGQGILAPAKTSEWVTERGLHLVCDIACFGEIPLSSPKGRRSDRCTQLKSICDLHYFFSTWCWSLLSSDNNIHWGLSRTCDHSGQQCQAPTCLVANDLLKINNEAWPQAMVMQCNCSPVQAHQCQYMRHHRILKRFTRCAMHS